MKKTKIKKIFGSPLFLNQTSSQTEFIIGKLYFAHIMHFQYTIYLIFVKFENIIH